MLGCTCTPRTHVLPTQASGCIHTISCAPVPVCAPEFQAILQITALPRKLCLHVCQSLAAASCATLRDEKPAAHSPVQCTALGDLSRHECRRRLASKAVRDVCCAAQHCTAEAHAHPAALRSCLSAYSSLRSLPIRMASAARILSPLPPPYKHTLVMWAYTTATTRRVQARAHAGVPAALLHTYALATASTRAHNHEHHL